MHNAAYVNDIDMVEFLINNGIEMNVQTNVSFILNITNYKYILTKLSNTHIMINVLTHNSHVTVGKYRSL